MQERMQVFIIHRLNALSVSAVNRLADLLMEELKGL